MAETHINAFFADVDEKLHIVLVAQGELQAAKDRLEAKKKEVGYVEPETPQAEASSLEEKSVEKTEEKQSVFKKNK